jgi:hypothetical protein
MLAPLTSLVRECGQTKVTRPKGTKKSPWHWDEVHQRAFDHIQTPITKEVVLAYSDYSKVFEIYIDASSKHLGAVITQYSRPIVFFSWKLFIVQHKNSVTKIELLAIFETLKEFKGMLWVQPIKCLLSQKSNERCSRLNLGPSVLMEVTAGRMSSILFISKAYTTQLQMQSHGLSMTPVSI